MIGGKTIEVARFDRKARHFLEGALLTGASALIITGACPWTESAERVQHDTERRRPAPVVSESRAADDVPASSPSATVAPAELPIEQAAATAVQAVQPSPSAAPMYREPGACTGPVRLAGSIVVAGQPEHSLAALSKGGGTSLLRIGQIFDGMQLAALLPRRAYMRQASGAYCTLHLVPSAEPPRVARRSKADTRPARNARKAVPFTQEELSAAIRSTGGDRYVVSRAFASQALGKLAGVRGLGRFAPDMRDGRSLGLRVHGVKRNSPLHRLGIRNGDVLRTLNGHSLANPDGLLAAAPLLQTQRSLSLALLRKGQPRTLQYSLQ
jgi:type II secretory pathway component PulC